MLLESFQQFAGLQNKSIKFLTLRSTLLNASQTIASEQPDVVMIDVTRSDAHIFELTERFKAQHRNIIFMMLTEDSSADLLIKAIRSGFSEVLQLPVTEQAISQALERLIAKKSLGNNTASKVISTISSKGGSGATFVATNLAYALAECCDKKVLVLDTNHFFGDAAMYVSEDEPVMTLADVCDQIHRLDNAFLDSSLIHVTPRLKVLAANNDPAKVADILPEHIEQILRLARNYYDFVVVDTGRQIDACTVKVLDMCDVIYPIVQLSLPYLRDTKSLMTTFRSLGYSQDKVKVIVNRYEKGNKLTTTDLRDAINVDIEALIPNAYLSVIDSVNQGVAICKLYKNSPVSKELIRMAVSMTGIVQSKQAGWMAKIFNL